ncbi:MAG: HEAT repeat domain-containing protein [Simkaniaceae bacterium]|nr:HEAT repeat domain-containing protein [Simkaniaceae bacterium]
MRFLFLFFTIGLYAHPSLPLLHKGLISEAIDEYLKGPPNFEVLEDMASLLLEKGMTSNEPETQMISLYGSSFASRFFCLHLCGLGITSQHPMVQMAAIHLLGRYQDDRAEEIYMRAFSSPHLMVRMEAAHELARIRSKYACGLIESLMHHLQEPYWVFFPELYALIGTDDATILLKKLISHQELPVRISTMISAARFGRDDFLFTIRSMLTHNNPLEQEAAAMAVGFLADSASIPRLIQLSRHHEDAVKLAACRSLTMLGDLSYEQQIIDLAREKNLFAISLCAQIEKSRPILAPLLYDPQISVRLNAALSMLKLRDPRAALTLTELLITDQRDLGFAPFYSPGGTLMAFRAHPSMTALQKHLGSDLATISLTLREMLLSECIELSPPVFLTIAKKIFDTRQYPLIPLLTSLLQTLGSEDAIDLLKEKTEQVGAPLIRGYANLALYHMGVPGPYEKNLFKWIDEQMQHELIRFRPMLSWTEKETSSFEMTPDEISNLLIRTYLTLAEKHTTEGVSVILKAIKLGHPKNRPALAGILLHAIE